MTDISASKSFAETITSLGQHPNLFMAYIRKYTVEHAGQSAGYTTMHDSMPKDIPATLEKTCLDNAKTEFQKAQTELQELKRREKNDVIAELKAQYMSDHNFHYDQALNSIDASMLQLKDILAIENAILSSRNVSDRIPDILKKALKKTKLNKDEITERLQRKSNITLNPEKNFDGESAYQALMDKAEETVEKAELYKQELELAYPEANKIYRELLLDFYNLGITELSSEFDKEMLANPKPNNNKTKLCQ